MGHGALRRPVGNEVSHSADLPAFVEQLAEAISRQLASSLECSCSGDRLPAGTPVVESGV
jgi:hypothetical protein